MITGATGADGPFPTCYVRDASPDVDGTIEIDLDSPDADCAVVVVFDDRDNNSALDLDGDGHPTEPYGVGKLTWQ